MSTNSDELYELLWSFVYLSVHHYGGSPCGEVLMVLTIQMLDEAGQNVTMSELAQITGLPKSNVSRYVSDQVRIGHLREHVDPRDRRRRVLQPTAAGRKERTWMLEELTALGRLKQEAEARDDAEIDLAKLLTQLTRQFQADFASDRAPVAN